MNIAIDRDTVGQAVDGGMFISNEQLARIDPDIAKARRAIRRMLMDLKEPKVIRGPVEKPKDVRIATPADEWNIYHLIMLDLEENAKVAPIAPDEVQEVIMRGTRQKGGIVAVIDGPDGKPVACTILVTEKWWWSKARHIQKVADFVHPDHRQSTHADHLIQFAKWCADTWTREFGYRIYLMSAVLGTKRVKDKMRLYSRKITPAGGFFLYPWPEPWD